VYEFKAFAFTSITPFFGISEKMIKFVQFYTIII